MNDHDTPPPRNKGGRPKGSKNRPKWLLDELKKVPKRPRGRPKGAKNLPKTLDELIVQSLESPRKPSPRPPKPKPKVEGRENYLSKLKREDPEKLREIQRLGVKASSKAGRKPKGIPPKTTNREFAIQKDEARKIAHRIYKQMDLEGALPENPIARKAMKTALEMLAEDNSTRDKLSIVRTLLEFNHSKPASTQNVNLRTAEDFLDELAAEDAPNE